MPTPATVTKVHLSGATNGQPIQVTAIATPGTVIHTDGNTANVFDEVWLWATNTSVSDRVLTLEIGGTGLGNEADYAIPAGSTVQILPGHSMSAGQIIAAYADVGSNVNIFGHVHRIDQS